MCLILFAWKSHPKYPLVVAANRDEFYERNTAGIAWWPEHPHILAGRDQADVIGSPGTWLGLTKHGRFSALTNVRSPSEKKPDARTRGELPYLYLTSADKPNHFIEKHSKRFDQYNGFNLLMADLSDPSNAEMHWLSNRVVMGKSVRPRKTFPSQSLTPGVYGLSNAMLDSVFHQQLQRHRGQPCGQRGRIDAHLAALHATGQGHADHAAAGVAGHFDLGQFFLRALHVFLHSLRLLHQLGDVSTHVVITLRKVGWNPGRAWRHAAASAAARPDGS